MAPRVLNETEARHYTTNCTHCGSEDFYSYGMEAEGPEMWQRFRCDTCDTSWTEVFLLFLIENEGDEV